MINLSEHIPADFPGNSRVWIYQANRAFHLNEVFEIEQILNGFVGQWSSHGAAVKGNANLFFGRFIVLMADESNVKVGGCSTDSSVHIVKEIQQKFRVDMFNRELIGFYMNDKVEPIPLGQVGYALNNGLISETTLFFDNTVQTKNDFLERWIVPMNETWLGRRFKILN